MPWYVAGPLIGLFVPALLLLDNRVFGISSNLRHLCAAMAPGRVEFFRYDWKNAGLWNLAFLAGVFVGGAIAGHLFGGGDAAIGAEARATLTRLGVTDFSGLAPVEIFSWSSLLTLRGLISIVAGGFLVGFFAGGLFCTYFMLPFLL
jgi:hypothetical protein